MQVAAVYTRLRLGFKDPVMRAKVLALFGGKMIGLTLLLTAMGVFRGPAVFADAGGPTPEINAINTAWTLIAAFLVFGMQVGFVMLEAGFARARESVNILVEGIADTCICGIMFWAFGFAFMFEDGNGFIGTHRLLPAGPARHLRHRPACRCWRSGSSSSPSPTPARRSPPAPWSAAAASSATCSTASASPASSTRSSATGPGVRTAGWR